MRVSSHLTLQKGDELSQLLQLIFARRLCPSIHHGLLRHNKAIDHLPVQTLAELGHCLHTVIDHLSQFVLEDGRVRRANQIQGLLLIAIWKEKQSS